jgi:hypothetical protein
MNTVDLRDTRWEDRHSSCECIDKIIARTMHSSLTTHQKTTVLTCLKEVLSDNTTQITQGLSERRNAHRTEIPVMAVGYELYNLTPFFGRNSLGTDLTESEVPGILFPFNKYMSKGNSVTKASLISMLNGAIKILQTEDKTPSHFESIKEQIKDFIKLSKPSEENTQALFESLTTAKQEGMLSHLLEYKHETKNYLIFSLMDKLSAENTQRLLKLAYPWKELDFSGNPNSVLSFTNFIQKNIEKNPEAKKERAFIVVRCMAFLAHRSEAIEAMPNTSPQRKEFEENYQHQYERFQEHLKNAQKCKVSNFRILTQIRSDGLLLVIRSLSKMSSRLMSSRLKIAKNAMVWSGAGAICLALPPSWGIIGCALAGCSIIWGLYMLRAVVSAMLDDPKLLHSSRTRTYTSLWNQLDKLKNFDPNPSQKINRSRDKLKEINQIFKEKSHTHSSEIFSKMLGSLEEEKKLATLFNERIKSISSENRSEMMFDQLLSLCSLDHNQTTIDKSSLLDHMVRATYLIAQSNLSESEKILLLEKLKEEIQNKKSTLGKLKNRNTYAEERHYFLYDLLISLYYLPGLLVRNLLSPVLSPLSLFLDHTVQIIAVSVGYPFKDFISSKCDKWAQPFGKTKSATIAKNFLQNAMEQLKAGEATI